MDERLRAALKWGDPEHQELADQFLEHKIATYLHTLLDLAAQYGYEVDPEKLHLSDEVLRALRAEADDHATSVVDTYNKDVDGFLQRNEHLPRELLLETFDAWASDRAENRAEQVAITEAYSASADAEVAFFAHNLQREPNFTFGGHPGDDPPACEVCKALVATNPHPLARVVEIGNPHIGCRQSWREEAVTRDDLPDVLELGQRVGGIIGGDALVNRTGSHDAAVAHLEGLTRGGL